MDGAGGGEEVLEKRRRPEETVLHEVVRRGWPELLAHLTLPPRVHTEVRRYLGCGMVYLAATLLLGIASPLATPRRWPFVFGLALALFAFTLTLTPR